MATTIILVRHGQTEWNRVERFRGHSDVALNLTGKKQSEVTGQLIALRWKPAAIFSSQLPRASKTAEIIAEYIHLTVETSDGLDDIDYGDWQGVTPEEAMRRWPEQVDAWYYAPHKVQIPGGETLDAVRKRVTKTVTSLVSRYEGKTIVLVSHTVINRVILLFILGLGNDRFWHIRQEPCAINVIEAQGGDYTLVSMNVTSHLDAHEPPR